MIPSLRYLTILFISIYLYIVIIESAPTVLTTCSPEEFQCNDGGCIPLDSFGNGKKECADGSDEQGEEPSPSSIPVTERIQNNPIHEKAIEDDNKSSQKNLDDPFDNIATLQPNVDETNIEIPKSKILDKKLCTDDGKNRRKECTSNLKLWYNDIDNIDFLNISILNDFNSVDLLQQGCEMLSQYRNCMGEFVENCHLPKKLKEWSDLEMYACQLLLPAAREHGNGCFSLVRNSQCPVDNVISTLTSPFCRLVRATAGDLDCIESSKTDEKCSELAVELLGPLKSETDHMMMESLICETIEDAQNKGDKNDDEYDDGSSSITTTDNDNSNITEEPKKEIIPKVVEKEEKILDVSNLQDKQTTNTEVSKIDDEPLLSSVNILDVLTFFTNLEEVCSEEKKDDQFLPLKSNVCQNKTKLKQHSECFIKTKNIVNCPTKSPLDVITKCDAIDAFNSNIDCLITTLNEECSVEEQEIVVGIQEKINDDAIVLQCYKKEEPQNNTESISNDGFNLTPKNTRCTSNQENSALVCLVELVELNKQMTSFASFNFLLEVSNIDSVFVNNICELYDKYEKCLGETVFSQNEGKRCAFNSPLNSLARIGLSPICNSENRNKLSEARECIETIGTLNQGNFSCKNNGLQNMGNAVQMMLQGIHGEALLCKVFYGIRSAFECGEIVIKDKCSPEAYKNLNELKIDFENIGIEEGCPSEMPSNLDEIIATPVKPTLLQSTSKKNQKNSTPLIVSPVCIPEEQRKFQVCVQNLTSYQPHPLAVIKTPRQIDEACLTYKDFKDCSKDVKCNPLWVQGMSAMFEYACGKGYDQYQNIKSCIRKTTTRNDIRECVTTFSKGAPSEACTSSKALLQCSADIIRDKCGETAKTWVNEYVQRFASAIDPSCKLEGPIFTTTIQSINCSPAEKQIINTCAAPLNDISSRLDELFEGGFQTFMKNVNNLAPVFAQGCNLTAEFRTCIAPIYATPTECVASSCLIRAGSGICNREDVSAAIDENLNCVFSNAGDPNFAKCLRTVIASVKDFNINTLRAILPKFVECVEPMVLEKCGPVPLNVLKSFGTTDVCPVELSPFNTMETTKPISPITGSVCDSETATRYDVCKKDFYRNYRFIPVQLVSNVNDTTKMCQEVLQLSQCIEVENVGICETKSHKALKNLIVSICKHENIYKNHSQCLSNVVSSNEGVKCLESYFNKQPKSEDEMCKLIQDSSQCLSKPVYENCGSEVINFAYDTINSYTQNFNNACHIASPSISLQTGCSEEDLIAYLQCEAIIDKYHYIPIAVLPDNTKLGEFCNFGRKSYTTCLDNLKCKFEPATTASLTLFDNLCGTFNEEQIKYGDCIASIFNSFDGKNCLQPITALDVLSKEGYKDICHSMTQAFECAAPLIEDKCKYEAVLHSASLYENYLKKFDGKCSLESIKATRNFNTTESDISIIKVTTSEPSKEIVTETTIAEDSLTTASLTTTVKTSKENSASVNSAVSFTLFSVIISAILFF
ncbi:Low-density lipoprotein (LDL) receptor class A repeat-containing protein [Strongyloides ratti]|uniref:Low-density lipoprotein (LDL) receptor class A repeat-containing protein n=1 Tax=Strongyloides ratti TaxID=34506 RepID=A0A090L2H1_STRRB|nr:Low-density lipoprotein (LDL) receptor class A repeat-containing protein [Strongyloides ratti]CEF63892.1 Low-density lipoprotein (LDL) receptor class A repeat-containing protein [Strongyloides ratti]